MAAVLCWAGDGRSEPSRMACVQMDSAQLPWNGRCIGLRCAWGISLRLIGLRSALLDPDGLVST